MSEERVVMVKSAVWVTEYPNGPSYFRATDGEIYKVRYSEPRPRTGEMVVLQRVDERTWRVVKDE